MSTERAERAQRPALEEASPLGFVAGDELELITRDAAARSGALTALLVVRNAPPNELDLIRAYGILPSEDRLSPSAGRSGFVGHVLESGRTAGEPISRKHNVPLATAASGAHVRYAVGAPVRPPGRATGALCVGLPAEPRDPGATIWLVSSYARVAALCLHDSAALRSILAAARCDALTGCLNYSAIRFELEREIARSSRHGGVVSCCFIDLDRFKQVNHRLGHLHGSRVLADVAAQLRHEVRISDTVGRYGGDEFVVVLPDTEGEAAYALAERLRDRICTTKRGHEPLDMSIGVAQWHPGMTADELLAAADDALRSAKRLGGGIVVGASDAAAGAGRGVAGAIAAAGGAPHARAGQVPVRLAPPAPS